MVYGIFSGCYSDWSVHGYFKDRDSAEKYCAKLNQKENEWDEYYVKNLPEIDEDVKDVKLKYYHQVVFDFDKGMRNEPDRYEYYIGEDRAPESIYNTFGKDSGWVSFSFNCNSRKRAEKIAQDKYYIFISKYKEFGTYNLAAQACGVTKVR